MDMPTVIAASVVVALGAAQYILMVQALRDLARRSRVRGDNKLAWALFILCLPIIGPVIYGWMGPTSLLRRQQAMQPHIAEHDDDPTTAPPPRRNITPISAVRHRHRSGDELLQTPPTRRFRRTGS